MRTIAAIIAALAVATATASPWDDYKTRFGLKFSSVEEESMR